MGEGEVADLPVELTLPLAVDVHFGDLDDVAHLQPQRRLVVRVGDPRLFHPSICWQLSLWIGKKGQLGCDGWEVRCEGVSMCGEDGMWARRGLWCVGGRGGLRKGIVLVSMIGVEAHEVQWGWGRNHRF